MATPQPPTPTPYILRLPGEIRNQIYSNLILSPVTVPIYQVKKDTDAETTTLASTLIPLLQTCRQIHLEASSLFYSHAQFALPPNASQAPHQIQTNVLFRGFLDRIVPRNAALIRHLVVPFPVDPEALVHAHLKRGGDAVYGDEEGTYGNYRSLVPALAARCPGLETVEFDVRWNNTWVRLLSPHTATVRAMLGRVDGELRAAFPRLKKVGVCLSGPARTWNAAGQFYQRAEEGMAQGEWEWVREALGEGMGWEVTFAEDDLEGTQREGWRSRSGWAASWYPPEPRHAFMVLYGAPNWAIQSEMHDQWTRLDVAKAYVRLGAAWVRSPTKAAQDREEAIEWRRWRRTMLAHAAPVGSSRKGNLKKGVGRFLGSRQRG
ncbi:hypothetical protein C8A01DRAFT_16610 [Parachaetomium inaequale]|uniref:Uncharacterized protein n=1 Tax=Parachaetomium inaequale TaxID=2588326 RepID=A0AAN6PEE4_9PEZI|nr:hypothetical protein C8A01DRAFT_16610 [Parachaetomium inaequale]